jgi:predicted MPP superfamily phosphohydrolase
MSLFFVVVFALWLALHLYVARRLVAPLEAGRIVRRFFYALWGLGYALAPLGLVLDAQLLPPYQTALRWLTWTYVGAFTVLFALLVARDLVVLALKLADRLRKQESLEPDRRRFLMRLSGSAALGATGVLTWLGVRAARRLPEVVEVDVPIRGLPAELDGYHIVQLSDVHVGMTIDKDFILPIVEQVTSLRPDLIALTGDLVDGNVDALHDDVSPLAYLRAPDGILFVTGNHEYYSGVEAWCRHFEELGITVLNNQHVSIARGAARLVVAGVPDFREGKRHPGHTPDPARALRGAPPHDVRILLAHQPRQAFAARDQKFALQLSGHTHGGQFWPWNHFIGLFEPLPTGMSRVGDTQVYVSRGTCYWGPPLRNGVPAEITSLRLRRT